jgi:hypothetical protein
LIVANFVMFTAACEALEGTVDPAGLPVAPSDVRFLEPELARGVYHVAVASIHHAPAFRSRGLVG